MGATAVALGATGYVESEKLEVIRLTVRLPHWDADGFRIAQISDVHLNHAGAVRLAQHAVRLAVAEKPDIIVFTGDFLNVSTPDTLRNIDLGFAGLSEAQCPCYGIMGNHDYACGAPQKVLDRVRGTHLKMLRNEVAHHQGVTIVGMDDSIFGSFDPTLVGRPGQSPSTVVLLHEPDPVDLIEGKASLQLSGHSHGGEVCFPGGFPIHVPRGAKNFVSGYYPEAKTPLFVSKGIATLGPARIFCPPDIAILTLRSGYGA